MAKRSRSRRRRNPTPLLTAAIAGGAAALGLAIGWALGDGERVAQPEWNWWVAARHTTIGLGSGVEYVPMIRSPKGEVFELAAEITEFGAANAAERAIRDRGGEPVEGKPVG